MRSATVTKRWLDKHEQWAHFVHRDVIARNRPVRAKASLPKGELAAIPTTPLPIDSTGNAAVACPMLGNNFAGDCGPVMMAHKFEILTFGQGKAGFAECAINQDALVSQYEAPQYSNGDNGTDEGMLVGPGGMCTKGVGLAGDPSLIVADHLDVDVTDVPLKNFCVDWFYTVELAWSVPDAVLQGFQSGATFTGPQTPNPQNGHFSDLADVDVAGLTRLWTWGGWCKVDDAFLSSVQPACFVAFSAKQFNAQGYDSHGRHVGDVAAAWVSIGGNASAVQAVVSQFPPKAQPPAPPAPVPTPGQSPTLAQVQAAITSGIDAGDPLQTPSQAIAEANAAVAKLYAAAS